MYRYFGEHIDYFDGCVKLWDFLSNNTYEQDVQGMENDAHWKNKILAKLAVEMAKMRALGWEGDVRGEVFIFTVPSFDDLECKIGFVWKQDNNGSTCVSSPFELPHLDGSSYDKGHD